jgi:hypothetical protein
MSRKVELHIGKATLGVLVSIHPHVLNGKGFWLNWGLETLCAVPSHVLDGNASSFRNEDEISESVDNHHSLRLFDDVWKDAQSGWDTLISSWKVYASGGARVPDYVRCVEGILDISPVEVHKFLGGTREPEDAPEIWPSIGHTIDIKDRIEHSDSALNRAMDSARGRDRERSVRRHRKRKLPRRRIGDEIIEIVCVAAAI